MSRRSVFSRKRSSGSSTLHLRDEAARAIAERVVRWRWETDQATTGKARAAALEKLGADLGPLADRYQERDRTHERLKVDSLAVADAAGVLERLRTAPRGGPQMKRVYAAAEEWLTSSSQRVRVGAEGRPVVLRMASRHGFYGEQLYGSREGRSEAVMAEEGLRAPRIETFEPFIGPEVPPPCHYAERCLCEADARIDRRVWEPHDFAHCPKLNPCGTDPDARRPRDLPSCGRLTYCGDLCCYCASPTWEAAAWLVRAPSSVPSYAKFMAGVAAEAGLELAELLQGKAAVLAEKLGARAAAPGGA